MQIFSNSEPEQPAAKLGPSLRVSEQSKPQKSYTINLSSKPLPPVITSASVERSHTLHAFPSRSVVGLPSPAAGPSRTTSPSQRSGSPLKSGYKSDSGSPSHLGLGPSRRNVPIHTVTLPSRGYRMPESRKSSGASAERDAGAHLDIKRLLSKPAPSSPSPSALQSDFELSGSSRYTHLPKAPRCARDRSPCQPSSSAKPVDVRPSSRDTSSSSRNGDGDPPQTHSVLKRRPSRPSTADQATPETPARHTLPRRRMRSIECIDISRSPSASPIPVKKAETKPVPTNLTPARQVALAYKQQEQRREEIAELSGWNDTAHQSENSTVKTTAPRRTKVSALPETPSAFDREDETTTGPYYTVFGSGSGHIVPFTDDVITRVERPSTAMTVEEYTHKPRKSLTRKVSGRFKKVAGAVVKKERDPSEDAAPQTPVPGHSRQPSWRPYDGREPVSKSPNMPAIRASTDERSTHTARSREKEGHASKDTPERECSLQAQPPSTPTPERDDDAKGGRFWRLVKRISTGGLRDKYRYSRDSTPPPVPPLPLDLSRLDEQRRPRTDSRSSPMRDSPMEEKEREDPPDAARSSSPSGGAPRHLTGSSQRTRPSRPSTGGKASSSPSVPRQSTTTRSSSPISSSRTSSGFFHKTQSSRSSSSSCGAEIPPVPQTVTGLGKYILPPSELHRLGMQVAESPHTPDALQVRRNHRSQSDPEAHRRSVSPFENVPSLPLPPQRTSGAGAQGGSPTTPSFSTDDAVNKFAGGVPPPRPKRSQLRKPASIELPMPAALSITTSLSTQTQTPMTPRSPRTPRPHGKSASSSAYPGFASAGAANPAAKDSLSPSSSSASTSPSTPGSNRPPVTFRELEEPRQAWTEKQKADKWEDLLMRSARAGGTLHISENGLLSDSMRMSQFDL